MSHKLVLSTCKAVQKEHAVLRYNFDVESFELMALAPIVINGLAIERTQEFMRVKPLD